MYLLCFAFFVFCFPRYLDIDECITGNHDCDVNANCINTVGSYNCSCKKGCTGDGRSCSGTLTLIKFQSVGYLDFYDGGILNPLFSLFDGFTGNTRGP